MIKAFLNELVSKLNPCHNKLMDKYNNNKNYKPTTFRVVTGVMPETFETMLRVIKQAYAQTHKNRGRHRKLSCEDMLLMTLEYYKEYRTLECIGASYGLTNIARKRKGSLYHVTLLGLLRDERCRKIENQGRIDALCVNKARGGIDKIRAVKL